MIIRSDARDSLRLAFVCLLRRTDEMQMSLEIGEILRNIPHRYPFLLIDRVLDCAPGERIRVAKNIGASDCGAKGPGLGNLPQLLALESLAQAGGALCYCSGLMSSSASSIMFFAGIDKFQYFADAVPGDQLVLECELVRAMRGVVKLRGEGRVSTRVLFKAELTAAIRSAPA